MKNTLTIREIKSILEHITDEHDPLLQQLANDSRKGVKELLQKWERKHKKKLQELSRLKEMMQYEKKARKEGYELIAGIDEVGRGPIAGPVVAAAVILPKDFFVEGINDSKKMSSKQRNDLYETINKEAISIGIGVVSAEEIDELNIYVATKKSMLLALQNMDIQPDFLLIDAVPLHTLYPEQSLVRGDSLSISIAAASIVAKVYRDQMMEEYHKTYPEYGFATNKGYGTKSHLEAIHTYGPCAIHRRTFEPIKSILAKGSYQQCSFDF